MKKFYTIITLLFILFTFNSAFSQEQINNIDQKGANKISTISDSESKHLQPDMIVLNDKIFADVKTNGRTSAQIKAEKISKIDNLKNAKDQKYDDPTLEKKRLELLDDLKLKLNSTD